MAGGAEPILALRIERTAMTGPGEPEVLQDVVLALRPGERIGLAGPSGTGKTTLLRIAAGLERRFTGTRDTGPGGEAPGMVFQDPRLLPWLSVARNIALPARLHTDAPVVAELLAALGLSTTGDLRPGDLSLGMARRVAIARALACAPKILLLDEPTASLDAETAAITLGVIADWSARCNAAVLVASHADADFAALGAVKRRLVGRPARLIGPVGL